MDRSPAKILTASPDDNTLIIDIYFCRLAQSLIPRKPGKPQVSIQAFIINIRFKRLEIKSIVCINSKDSDILMIKLALKIVFIYYLTL